MVREFNTVLFGINVEGLVFNIVDVELALSEALLVVDVIELLDKFLELVVNVLEEVINVEELVVKAR